MLAAVALLTCAAATSAAGIKVGAVKGAKYTGAVRNSPMTITVSGNGKSAKASIPFAPAYCQGGGGGEVQHTKPASISKSGLFTAKITYTVMGSSRVFATVTIKGTFLQKSFDGTAKSSFTPATSCSGQSSFAATASSRSCIRTGPHGSVRAQALTSGRI
jgi:hypothetical protein